MAVPKQRHTKSRRNKRRSHHALKKQAVFYCSKCKATVKPHYLCHNCGTYDGKEVVDVMAKLTKKERKKKEKEIETQAKEQQQNKPLSMTDMSKK